MNLQHLSDDFLNRVKHSYQIALSESPVPRGEIWPMIDGMRRSVHDALLANDTADLRRIFADPIISNLYYGVDNLAATIEDSFSRNPNADAAFAKQAENQVAELASALGLRRWVPTESERYADYHREAFAEPPLDTDKLLDLIEDKIGYDLAFPNPFRGERGASTSRGLVSYRAVAAVYQALRIGQEKKGSHAVLEIGPGMGRTAYYATQAGISGYTTIDLPLGVVGQACYLGAVLGPEALWMIGDQGEPDGRIRILPTTKLANLNERFSVVLNTDSLTELGREGAIRYLTWIANQANVFISINHEANHATISDLAKSALSNAEYRRFPYWLRHGYAEEIFVISSIR
jgi:hypothetical protein